MTTEKKHRINQTAAKWDKANTRQIKFKFNLRTDQDILSRLGPLAIQEADNN